MTIGALGAYGVSPYVYNTNIVSAASMNKLSRISDDVLDKKVDYSEYADESRNVNPLKKGQTLDFQSMLQMQMRRGQDNAARIMKPAENTEANAETKKEETQNAKAEQSAETAVVQSEQAFAEAAVAAAGMDEANANANGNGGTNYQMQQAINAYEMFMTA